MDGLDLSLPTVAENLAMEAALLEEAEASPQPRETLRIWESPEIAVVVGRASIVPGEVDVQYCRARNIPIRRRTSGGCAVVAGPGCLMYSVILNIERRPFLQSIDAAHEFVLDRLVAATSNAIVGVQRRGISDLTWNDAKISGNSLQVKRRHVLYHGTLLYDFPLDLIESCLKQPPREPDYRRGRRHREFVANLPATAEQLRDGLFSAWEIQNQRTEWPAQRAIELVHERYERPEWNERR
ncbi:MAG: hypothetical protein N2C14_32010 [Planctomycetales bacterium]